MNETLTTDTASTTATARAAPTDPLARISLELLAEYRVASDARDAADRRGARAHAVGRGDRSARRGE